MFKSETLFFDNSCVLDLRVTAGSNLISPICGKIYSHEVLAFELAIPANKVKLGVAPQVAIAMLMKESTLFTHICPF